MTQKRSRVPARKTKSKTSQFDKYELYSRAVQSPKNDVRFFAKVYEEIRGRAARTLREDFCGTGALSIEWVKMNKVNRAYGVDLDPEPIHYGQTHYLSRLPKEQQSRMHYLEKNVLDRDLPKADLSVGLNFSYFLFKKRQDLRAYFENVHRNLLPKGLAFFDVFGGSQCYDAIEDRTRHSGFTYYWEQMGFDPVTNEAQFHIHFRLGQKKIERVFSYDWRLWSIPELQELLLEAGFQKIHVYWEGTAKDGTGNGIFRRVHEGEACLSWIAYLVAEA